MVQRTTNKQTNSETVANSYEAKETSFQFRCPLSHSVCVSCWFANSVCVAPDLLYSYSTQQLRVRVIWNDWLQTCPLMHIYIQHNYKSDVFAAMRVWPIPGVARPFSRTVCVLQMQPPFPRVWPHHRKMSGKEFWFILFVTCKCYSNLFFFLLHHCPSLCYHILCCVALWLMLSENTTFSGCSNGCFI